jgi:hypothetical protein
VSYSLSNGINATNWRWIRSIFQWDTSLWWRRTPVRRTTVNYKCFIIFYCSMFRLV